MRSKRRQPRTSPRPKFRSCRRCKAFVAAGVLVHGECPDCMGLIPLPLTVRGADGRFVALGVPRTGKAATAPEGGETR